MSGPEPLNAPKIEKTPAGAFLEEVSHVGEKFHAVTKGPAPTPAPKTAPCASDQAQKEHLPWGLQKG